MAARYADRTSAGAALAGLLPAYRGRPDVIALGLVRGGVPVAAEVAGRLAIALDILVVRKLGVPWAPEVAFGALGPGGVLVRNEDIAEQLEGAQMAVVRRREERELERRARSYRAGRPPLELAGRTAIVIDDGLATGATARAAVVVARELGAGRVVLAVPVGSPDAVRTLCEVADEVVCPAVPRMFGAVSRYYDRFPQTTDEEVRAYLGRGTIPE